MQKLQSFLFQIPILTRLIALFCVTISIVGKFFVNQDGVVPFFAMVPGYTLPPTFYLWTMATAGFFETSLINLAGNVIIFLLIGGYVENLWGSLEYSKFVFIVQVGTNFALLVILIFLYGSTKSTLFLYGVDIHGMASVMGAFLVVYKQVLPESKLDLGPISIRVKDGPLISIFVFLFLYLVGWTRFTELLCCIFGIYISWIYLRFFQKREGGRVGDRSETFQFATFFPERFRPIALTISTITFRFLILCNVCRRVTPDLDTERLAYLAPPSSSLIGGEPHDAERRRNLATAQLEARLAKKGTDRPKDSLEELVIEDSETIQMETIPGN